MTVYSDVKKQYLINSWASLMSSLQFQVHNGHKSDALKANNLRARVTV